jgi:hypothetical protein
MAPEGSVSEAHLIEPGETVFIRDNAERNSNGRMALMLKGKILFCDSRQFWRAAD